jgi:phosphatidylserine decarboxylase
MPLAEASDIERTPAAAGLIARVAAAIGIAPEGMPLSLCAAALAMVVLGFGMPWLAACVLAIAIAIGAFFRDPERTAASPENAILSAADGKVTDIRECLLPGDQSGERFRRVSVFMSPLNVHVNRAPAAGNVIAVAHTPGEFRAAFRDDANEHNERNLITFADVAGRRYAIMQIAGYLARRIVCRIQPHDAVVRGQRVGLIMFGSRVDHFMPLAYRVTVRAGDRVSAGESVIGEPSQ